MAMAQDKFTLQCYLCKSYNDVKWKCLECDEWFCFSCKTAHSNSKASKDHNLSSLMDANVAEQLQIQSKLCNVHKTESVCMYCKDCQQTLCLRCITGEHKSHDFENLSDYISRKMNDLTNYLDAVKKHQLEDLEKSVREIQCNQDRYDKGIQICIDNMRQHGRQLKDAVDKIVEKSIKSLERRAKEDKASMRTMKNKYVKQTANLRGEIQNAEKKIQSSSNIEIIKMSSEIKSKIKGQLDTMTIKQPIYVQLPNFIHQQPDTNASDVLKQVFGYFDFEKEDERKCSECDLISANPYKQPHVKVISKFQSGVKEGYISCCNHEMAWLGSQCLLNKIKKDGSFIKSIKTQNGICDLATFNTGQLLISTRNFSIDTLNSSETSTTLFCKNDICFYGGICVTRDGDIYQCQHNKVVKISPDGKKTQIIDSPKDKYADVKSLMCITQNVNGDLWITSADGSRCVVLSEDGVYKFSYKGSKDIQLKSSPNFTSLTSNKNGEVLICDHPNNKIHMVDRDGNFIQFLLTEKHGIQGPCDISNYDRTVWVVCVHGDILVAEY